MATYNQVSYGSQGSDVKKLQELLNKNGYNLSADGIFGANTQAAVKDYQKKNNLSVDGIVGNNTWGALTKASASSSSSSSATQPPTQAATPTTKPWSYEEFQMSQSTANADKNRQEQASQKPGDFSYDPYEKSDVVKQAEALLQQQLSQKPGAYQSQWQTQLDETLAKILNREEFSYDLNGDALYQQYKDQYMLQGQQAMMDTMGQAAALTGGYGNSYAQTAGQQTYQGYLQQLNDRIPELYQLALNQYNQEGQNLYNQYGLYADREQQDYGRYRDQVSDYQTELARLTEDARYQGEQDYGKYLDAYNIAYGQHRDQVGDWQAAMDRADADYWNQYNRDYGQYTDDRNLSYQQNRDQISDSQWEQSLRYQQDRDKISDEQWQAQFDEAKRQFDLQYGKSSSDSPYRYPGDGPNESPEEGNGSVSKAAIINMQKSLGVEADGVWGPQSQAAAGGRSAEEAYALWNQGKLEGAYSINEGNIKAFQSKLHPESQHDAVARDQYGSYRQYVAQQIENSNLSDGEKLYLITYYGITEADTHYKK